MTARRASAASWALALLAAAAFAAGALLTYVDRTVFDRDAFADRAAATLDKRPVRAAVARQLTDAVVKLRPNLVAVRPIVDLAAERVVATSQFRSLVRRAALESHRSAFDEDRRAVTLRIRDAGLLVRDVVLRLRPDAASRFPTKVVTPVARIRSGVNGAMLRVAERAEGARRARRLALFAAAVLAVAAFVVTDARRASVARLGVAAAFAGGVVALACVMLPPLVTRSVGEAQRAAVRAALEVWLHPVVVWAVAAAAVGVVVALAAAGTARDLRLAPLLQRARAVALRPARNRGEGALRAGAALALGIAMVARPRDVLTLAIVAAGVVLAVGAVTQLLALSGAGAAPRGRARALRVPRALAVAGVVALVAAGAAVGAALSDDSPTPLAAVGRCNGHASLCDRRLEDVAFLGTHNAMAVAGQPRWLFATQDGSISEQLEDGVRALMIDTHYGFRTPRGVATDLSADTGNRGKQLVRATPALKAAAKRVQRSLAGEPRGARQVYLCHAFCEVGATRAVDALAAVHRFLVRHPEEVAILSIEDDTSQADLAAVFRSTGLIDEVYRGPARPPWPSLRELIDRDERVLVLAENHSGPERWIHRQPAVAQETPYHFGTAAQLSEPAGCEPNRGGTAGSLLLVNHWVDTSPAPRPTIAREVNARAFLAPRLATCRRRRGKLANVVAVDFYRQGDAAVVVDELNGVVTAHR